MHSSCYLCDSNASKEVFFERGISLRKCRAGGHFYSGWTQNEPETTLRHRHRGVLTKRQ